jgi:hypothetical protein
MHDNDYDEFHQPIIRYYAIIFNLGENSNGYTQDVYPDERIDFVALKKKCPNLLSFGPYYAEADAQEEVDRVLSKIMHKARCAAAG